jgi:hypothetical protein
MAFGKDLMSPDVFMDMVSDAWLCVCVALRFGLILGMRDIKIKTQDQDFMDGPVPVAGCWSGMAL